MNNMISSNSITDVNIKDALEDIINRAYINIEIPNKFNNSPWGLFIIDCNPCNGIDGGILFNKTIKKNISEKVNMC
jgi:hypothetical protein